MQRVGGLRWQRACRRCRRAGDELLPRLEHDRSYQPHRVGLPDLHLTIANRMAAGEFVVDEEHVSGMHFGDMPTEITAERLPRHRREDRQTGAPVLTSTGELGSTERRLQLLLAARDRL